MNFRELLLSCGLRAGALALEVDAAEAAVGCQFPDDYKAFLLQTNGVEGFLGEGYIMLWGVTELGDLNRGYMVEEFAPGVTLIGTNGGNTGYGFRGRGQSTEYVSVPLIGMEPEEVVFLGNTLVDFLDRLRKGEGT